MSGLLVRDYFQAWTSHDASRIVSFMADDVVYEDVALGARYEGREAVMEFVAETERWSNDLRFDLVSEVQSGDSFAAEWVMSGTNTGETRGLPATGKTFSLRGSSVGRLNSDGLIVENRDYWNAADYLVQVGILPPAGNQSG